MAAVVTLLEMATENSSPADLDRGQNPALRHRKRSAMFLTIGFAKVAKHICHLQLGTIHVPELEILYWSGLGLSGNGLWEQIEGTGSGAHFAGSDAQIAGGGSQTPMTQQELNGAQVGSGFKQVGCKTVSKRMGRDRFDNAATLKCLLTRMLHRRFADMPTNLIAREEPLLGPGYWPPVTQDLQQLW
jgi:hypothetical protein